MKADSSVVTVHMVCSLDGFIACPDKDILWMKTNDRYDKGIQLTAEKINEVLAAIDCYVMGSYTYEHATKLGWPYGDKPVIVCTSRQLSPYNHHVSFHQNDISTLIESLRNKYQYIWMVGGSAMTKSFLQSDIADCIIVTILPILLGEGLRFFDDIKKHVNLHLKDVTSYNDGTVELTYDIV